jgi:hypothetical protein
MPSHINLKRFEASGPGTSGKDAMKSVRILLNTCEDDYGLGEVSHAVIALDVSTISEILKQMDELTTREDVHYYSTFDASPDWLDGERAIWKALRGEDVDSARVEVNIRETSKDAVNWSALYKHTDCKMWTDHVGRKTLEKLLDVCNGNKDEDQLDLNEHERGTLNVDLVAGLEEQFGKKKS